MIKRRYFALALPLLLAACGGAPAPKPPATLALTIIGGADQNPAPGGAAQPVAVRIYPLASTGKFAAADPYTMMGNATGLLGTDLAGPSDQVIVAPGATVHVNQRLPDTAQSLGIVVLFQQIDQAQWRAISALTANKPNNLTLHITGLKAKLAPSVTKG